MAEPDPARAASPRWVATARYRLRPAPRGLALVQDLLNTRASEEYGPDLLRDSANAEAWAAHAVRAWSAEREISSLPPALTNHDAGRLRDLRSALERALAGVPLGRLDSFSSTARFTLTDAADISWMPRGQGWRWLNGRGPRRSLVESPGRYLAASQAVPQQRLPGCVLRQQLEYQWRVARPRRLLALISGGRGDPWAWWSSRARAALRVRAGGTGTASVTCRW